LKFIKHFQNSIQIKFIFSSYITVNNVNHLRKVVVGDLAQKICWLFTKLALGKSGVVELMLRKGLWMMLLRWSAVMSSFSENARARSCGSTNWFTWKFPRSSVTSSFLSHLRRRAIFGIWSCDCCTGTCLLPILSRDLS